MYNGSFFYEFYYCFFEKKINFTKEQIKNNLCKIFDMMDGSYRKLFANVRNDIKNENLEKCCIFLSFIYDINLMMNDTIYHGITNFDLYKPFIILKNINNQWNHVENQNKDCILRYPNDTFLIKIYYDFILKKHIRNEYDKKLKNIKKWDKLRILEYSKKLEINTIKKGKKKQFISKTKTELINEILEKLTP